MSEGAKFKAFLSYSRKDEDAVRRLHRRLEHYEIPRALRVEGQRRLGRFFRDKDELGAASELGNELKEKIAAAEWLIICCSPASAASQWVSTEVDAYIATHGRGRVLAVILDGEPHEVFPPSLRESEPLAADFRKMGDGEEIGFLKLVAGLLGADLGELRDRQAAAERARTRNRAILAGVFGVLAITSSVLAIIAVQQRERAEAMTLEAIDIGAGVVTQADNLSTRFGVPTSALEELLGFASERFDRLFAHNVQSPELARQQAGMRAQFAELYLRTGNTERARDEAVAALEAFDHLPESHARTLPYVRALLAAGQAEFAQGRANEAMGYMTRAIESARALPADAPGESERARALGGGLQRLGELHMRAGRAADARPLFTEAAQIFSDLYEREPSDGAIAGMVTLLDWRGSAEAAMRDHAAAQVSFETAVRAGRIMVEADAENLSARSTLGYSLAKLGQTLADQQNYTAARAPLEESLAIARTLVASDPNDAEFQNALALRLMLTANVLTSLGEAPRAMVEEAIGTARAQSRADPTNVETKELLARMLAVRAARRSDAGENAAARTDWREIVQLRRDIRAASPANAPATAANLAYALEMVGDASAGLRDLPTMLTVYGEAATLRRAALAATPRDAAAQASLAAVLHALGLSKKFNNDGAGARDALGESARLRLALHNANRNDAALAFATVDTLQQLALVQAEVDGAATTRSFEQARDILRRLVAAYPNDARYADSLRRTEDVLATIAAGTSQ
jgi:tetratricopeptide (TPR) repeat protein